MPGRGFCKARVFRRTDNRSYSVQLMAEERVLPGVIEVHCADVDWLWNTEHMDRQWQEDRLFLLERRLQKLGTRQMFASGEGKGMPLKCVVAPIDFSEGVEVELGQYVPARAAFVQCRLRADLSKLQVNATRLGDSSRGSGASKKRDLEDREAQPQTDSKRGRA